MHRACAWDQLTDAGKSSLLQHFSQCSQAPPSSKAKPSASRPTRSIQASDVESFVLVYRALAVGSDDDDGNHINQDDDNLHEDNQEQEDQEELCTMLTKSKTPATHPESKSKNIPGNISRLLSSKPKNQSDKLIKGQGPVCGGPCW